MQNFDWEFYVSYYPDVKNAGFNTQKKAIYHYIKFGKYEQRRTHQIIFPTNNITYINSEYILSNILQVYVSKGLYMFKERIFQKYNLKHYFNTNLPSLFFGVYTDDDLYCLNKHNNIKYIIWGGQDVNNQKTLNEVKNLHNCIHLSISECIYKRLLNSQINSILIDFNLVDHKLFKPCNVKGNNIFIFNGQTKGREAIYGKKYYKEITNKLPQFNFILSNTLNCKHEEMPSVYAKCFIMLRLTEYDGNANSVQECEAMNIPVVHNQSKYGLKWKSVDDIISHILHFSKK